MITILFVMYIVSAAGMPIWIGYEWCAGKRSGVIWEERTNTCRAREGAKELPPAPPALYRT
jgi:hypothetical protein